MKYEVFVYAPNGGADRYEAEYVSCCEARVLCFKVNGKVHETSLPWFYREIDKRTP